MRLSTDRILTTHTGSLPRPGTLADKILQREHGTLTPADTDQLTRMIEQAVLDVVARQGDCGLDVINDGEMSKIGYATYVKERLTGFEDVDTVAEEGGLKIADLDDYPGMAARSLDGLDTRTPTCVGPINYVGQQALQADLNNLARPTSTTTAVEGFMTAASPGVTALYLPNKHYDTLDDYLFAIAEAMRTEYEAIVDAGLVLQIDAPDLAMGRHIQYSELSEPEFVARVEVHVAAINHAVRNIDPAQVRVHLCWGNYQGPHHHDVALRSIITPLLALRPHGLVFEHANHRHAHEWRVFEDVSLPDDKVLFPGVIDTSSIYVEHPELVAERIVRLAGMVGRERVIPTTDCGFASFASFLAVDPEIAWAKLGALVEGAHLASERLW